MYEIKKYPDGTSYAIINKVTYNIPTIIKNVSSSVNEITFRINNYEDLWHLNQLVDAYNSLGIKPDILIPNLIDAQADRRFNKNESSGFKLVCKFLNQMEAAFRTFHPHNQEVVEALLDNVEIIDNSDFIKRIIHENTLDNVILFSSDAGGFKPLMKLCDKIGWKGETFSASKSRKYEGGKSKLIQEINKTDFEGRDIMIIDDICVYGGTFKGLSKMLRERNCGKLYLAVSHITIQHHPQDSVFEYFDKVFCTNSKYDEYTAENNSREMLIPENLEIIRLFNSED